MEIYDIAIQIAEKAVRWSSKRHKKRSKSKYSLFANGQNRLIEHIEHDMQTKKNCPVIWFHASSLGEFAVARPLIKRLKEDKECIIVVTFFSPTGYEALKTHHPLIDYLYYLPIDTKENACKFLNAIQPDKAVFIISEYWCNYLQELEKRKIPTYLVSGIIHKKAPFFKWYGGIYRRSLSAYTHFFVLDEESKTNLNLLGHENVTVCGDPLFDNAAVIARTAWNDPIVERFSKEGDLFIAGSISDKTDLELMSKLAHKHKDTRFIFVPHEISEEKLNKIKFELRGSALLYSECDNNTDFSSTQVLIIDFLGALAYLYRYAKWAYVGGGFTPYLHSVIEAIVYGIPVSFGPKTYRKTTPAQLMQLNIGQAVRGYDDLNKWFSTLKHNEAELKHTKEIAASYVEQNTGATGHIIATLKQGLWEQN